jgi:hypothetical protein
MGSICISCGQYCCRGYVLRVHDRDDLAGPCGVGIDLYYNKMIATYLSEIEFYSDKIKFDN